MTNKEVIKKLHLLQSVQPESHTKSEINERILSEIISTKPFSFKKLFSIFSVKQVIALTAVLLFSVLTLVVLFPNAISSWIVSAKLTFASDRYQKAEIALDYAEFQFTHSSNNAASLSQSLTFVNNEMSGLILKGEKEKYTMQQCLALYTKYHTYLETMIQTANAKINANQDKQSEIALLAQIKQYDTQAEKRLQKYKE